MREGFFGLNVAVRGLYTAQKSLDIVNHNINNVNTPGYSRQTAVQTASRPMPVYDGTGMIGTGSDITAVQRVRDEYLDYKYWSENIAYGEWEAKKSVLADMEATFNEPSDSGFTVVMNDFYSSLQELAKDPASSAVRSLVRQKGVSVAKYFNSTAAHFEKLQADVDYRIKTKVMEVNSYATQIAQLNRQIYTSELDGSSANDLRDQRTLLVDKMSKIVNIEANEVVTGKRPDGSADKHFIVTISGKAIVNHYEVSKLAAVQREPDKKVNEEDITGLYQVEWEDGNKLEIKGGELRGYLDVRDGNEGQSGPNGIASPIYKGIPYYLKKLNQFARVFAKAFNEGIVNGVDGKGHADGYGLDPDGDGPGTGATGIRFFTMMSEDGKAVSSDVFQASGASVDVRYSRITAKNFSVSEDVLTDSNAIAAAGGPDKAGDIENLNALLDMRQNPHMFTEGSPEDFMKSLISTLGVDSQQAVRYSDNQETFVKQIDNRKLSDSGVSLDEEMANLVKFQHAYNAAAKMVSTMAEIYDTLINKVGVR